MRYLVFAFPHYYPSGGFNDILLMTDNISDVRVIIESSRFKDEFQNYQIIDTVNRVAIYKNWGWEDDVPAFSSSDWIDWSEFLDSV